MKIITFIILPLILYILSLFSDSPHGKDFKISCNTCHSSKSWAFDKEIYSFDHSKTNLPLLGQHKELNCKICHPTLVFSEAKSKSNCNSCHTDIHSQSLGIDCSKCHTPDSWLVNNVADIHQQSRFPLVGVHTITDCQKCHKSESLHRFDVLGVECVDCHRDRYFATTSPSHVTANFSTECSQCHFIYSYEWGGTGFNHSFFPLTLGHANIECARCHTNGNYSNLSPECYSCHQADYNSTTNPPHLGSCYPTNCKLCHTTNPGWRPVDFSQHDSQYFPITSGKHSGFSCTQCHTNPGDCSQFSCIVCHSQADTNGNHGDVSGYTYSSSACYSCHPRGSGGGG